MTICSFIENEGEGFDGGPKIWREKKVQNFCRDASLDRDHELYVTLKSGLGQIDPRVKCSERNILLVGYRTCLLGVQRASPGRE
jgi:hypothetical protein